MKHAMTSENQITEGGILRPLLAFFFPILLGTFFQQLYNTADAVVVGNYVGTVALAAVGGSTSTLIGLFVNLFVGVASGTTVIIAQCYGARIVTVSARQCIPRWPLPLWAAPLPQSSPCWGLARHCMPWIPLPM